MYYISKIFKYLKNLDEEYLCNLIINYLENNKNADDNLQCDYNLLCDLYFERECSLHNLTFLNSTTLAHYFRTNDKKYLIR